MLSQALILAGGKGTRLDARLNARPKPLVDVLGVPLLERQVLALRQAGVTSILVLVNHQAAQIADFCDSHRNWGINLKLIDDGKPRGTAGAVMAIREQLDDDFLVVYGDTLFNIDLGRFHAFHVKDPATAGTLLVHPNDHPVDSDIAILDSSEYVVRFSRYPHPPGVWLPNMVNAAMYMLRRQGLDAVAKELPSASDQKPVDFAKDLFPQMLKHGLTLRGYVSPEYIKDIGTPARLDNASAALQSGAVARASLVHRQRAVFLDRDGTVTEHDGYIASPDALRVYPFAATALRLLNDHEYRRVLVTNQPVLARGDCKQAQFEQVQAKLETTLGAAGGFFDRIYYCPHHPDAGFPGEVASLKVDCDCRKPKPGMLLRAAQDMNIDLGQSWMIGDSTADLLAARRAGVTSILVNTGEAGADAKHPSLPDFVCANVLEAARFITETYERIRAHPAVQKALSAIGEGEDWFIAGQARAGKSTLANVLARELKAAGIPCVVITTDRWIRSTADRSAGFLGRHDLDGLKAALALAQRRRKLEQVTLDLPLYLRHARSRANAIEAVTLKPGTAVLWEGVTAGELLARPGPIANAIFVESSEDCRRPRVVADLVARGSSIDEANALYDSRFIDEGPVIEGFRPLCTHHVTFSTISSDRLSATCNA